MCIASLQPSSAAIAKYRYRGSDGRVPGGQDTLDTLRIALMVMQLRQSIPKSNASGACVLQIAVRIGSRLSTVAACTRACKSSWNDGQQRHALACAQAVLRATHAEHCHGGVRGRRCWTSACSRN